MTVAACTDGSVKQKQHYLLQVGCGSIIKLEMIPGAGDLSEKISWAMDCGTGGINALGF